MSDTLVGAPALLHKSLPVYGQKVIDDEQGIIEAFVSGIGNRDSVGDIIEPGAFVNSLKRRNPKGVWSHDWNNWVAKTLEVFEVAAGNASLPMKMKAAGIGGLYVKMQFNLDTERGRDAFSDVKFFDDEAEWSIGYLVIDSEYDADLKATRLKEIELYEYSPVLFGANPLTSTVSVKVGTAVGDYERTVEVRVEGPVDQNMKEQIEMAVKNAIATEEATDETKALGNPATGAVETEVSRDTGENKGSTEDADGGEGTPKVKDDKSEIEIEEKQAVAGSYEERQELLHNALREEFGGGMSWTWPVATFESSVVFVLEEYDGEKFNVAYFQVDYSIADGEVTFGEKVEVDVVAVVVAKLAQAEIEAKGYDSKDLDLKVGRVLSKSNRTKVSSAVKALNEVLEADKEEESEEKGAKIDPEKLDGLHLVEDEDEKARVADEEEIEDETLRLSLEEWAELDEWAKALAETEVEDEVEDPEAKNGDEEKDVTSESDEVPEAEKVAISISELAEFEEIASELALEV